MLGAAGLSLVPCHPQVHTHLAARALQEGIYSLGMSLFPSLTLLPQNSTHSLRPDEMTAKTKEVEVLALEESTGLEEDALSCSPAELSKAASAPGMQQSCAGEDLGWRQWGLAPLLCLDGCWRSLRWDTAPGLPAQGRGTGVYPGVTKRVVPGVAPASLCRAIRARQRLGQGPGAALASRGAQLVCARQLPREGSPCPRSPKQPF